MTYTRYHGTTPDLATITVERAGQPVEQIETTLDDAMYRMACHELTHASARVRSLQRSISRYERGVAAEDRRLARLVA